MTKWLTMILEWINVILAQGKVQAVLSHSIQSANVHRQVEARSMLCWINLYFFYSCISMCVYLCVCVCPQSKWSTWIVNISLHQQWPWLALTENYKSINRANMVFCLVNIKSTRMNAVFIWLCNIAIVC